MSLPRNIILLALVVALILLLPLAAMKLSAEVNWSLFDFAVAGVLLFGTGLAYLLVTRNSGNIAYKAAIGLALGTALLLVWLNLAVGIIGSENNPANWMYLSVLAVGLVGALVARFQPRGLARTFYATAFAQGVVALIALILEKSQDALQILALNGLFVLLWVGCAWLFGRADAEMNRQLE